MNDSEPRVRDEFVVLSTSNHRNITSLSGSGNSHRGGSYLMCGQSLPDLTNHVFKQETYPAAHGGFADIWVCHWTPGGNPRTKKVAVKVLRSVNGAKDKRKLDRRLRRELAVWLALDHPRVLPLYGVVSEFGPYLSMVCPWMENGNLNTYLSGPGETSSMERRYEILRQVCSGLAYLHSCSVVHGDLTGSNVLLDSVGDACLSDFGLSTIVSDIQSASTLTTSIGGNVRFAAPEIYRVDADDSLPVPTVESDVYSFGSVTLQTLTGKIPYYYLRTDGQVLIELTRGQRPRRSTDPVITDPRWNFLCACWANQPSDRPDTQTIQAYMSHPDNYFVAKRESLPELGRIRFLSLLNVTHMNFESWNARSNHQTVFVKLITIPLSEQEKLSTIQGLRKIGMVQHDHILAYLGVSMIGNTIALAMPWVGDEYLNLCSYLCESVIPIAQRFVVIEQVALALGHLHLLSIVHGGLTGWNVVVYPTGNIKLRHYGIMPFIYKQAHPRKLAHAYNGDFRWADPALWFPTDTSRPNISRASDIFAFGRIAFQVLTAKQPFEDELELKI